MSQPVHCHCGRPLHYTYEHNRLMVEKLVAEQGEFVRVTVAGRTWLVQRHFIALHGVKAEELPTLGFQEITGGKP